jgi:hypothetical protein
MFILCISFLVVATESRHLRASHLASMLCITPKFANVSHVQVHNRNPSDIISWWLCIEADVVNQGALFLQNSSNWGSIPLSRSASLLGKASPTMPLMVPLVTHTISGKCAAELYIELPQFPQKCRSIVRPESVFESGYIFMFADAEPSKTKVDFGYKTWEMRALPVHLLQLRQWHMFAVMG